MKKAALIGFALLSIGNGIFRFLTTEQGRTGLIFGAVMGGMALAAAFLIKTKAWIVSYILGGLALFMTAGFFIFAMLKKQDEYGLVRPIIMTTISVVALILLLLPARKTGDTEEVVSGPHG